MSGYQKAVLAMLREWDRLDARNMAPPPVRPPPRQ